MRCFGLQDPTYVDVCVMRLSRRHSTPAWPVIVCSRGSIGLLNYSEGCRNAVIYTVLHWCVCVNPLVFGCWQIYRRVCVRLCQKYLGKTLFCPVWVVHIETLRSLTLSFNVFSLRSGQFQYQGQVLFFPHSPESELNCNYLPAVESKRLQ